jgi:hypothetical protein
MEIDEAIYSPESGTLRVKCSGEFGLGADGNPSGELLTRTIRRWVSDHKEERVVEIEIDYSSVNYSWGDGPVSSMAPLRADGVERCRIIASMRNCGPLKSLLENCNLPWFELARIDEIDDERVLTPVPLKMRIRIPFDETQLSVLARDFAARVFTAVPELKNHAHMITSRNSEECDLRIEAQSPTGDPGRRLEISMDAKDEEPRVRFGSMEPQTVEGQTIVNLIERIVHDQLVIGVVVGGPFDGSETLVDLGNPHSLREELTGQYSSGRLEVVSWGGSADREVSTENLG